MKIKKGYSIYIETWDCDGDNNSNQHIDGLDELDVKFFIEFLKNFNSYNNVYINEINKFGNTYIEYHVLSNLIDDIFNMYPSKYF